MMPFCTAFLFVEAGYRITTIFCFRMKKYEVFFRAMLCWFENFWLLQMLRNYMRNQKPSDGRVPSTKYPQFYSDSTLLQSLSTTNNQYTRLKTFTYTVIYVVLFKYLVVLSCKWWILIFMVILPSLLFVPFCAWIQDNSLFRVLCVVVDWGTSFLHLLYRNLLFVEWKVPNSERIV